MSEEKKMHLIIETHEPIEMRIVVTNEEVFNIAMNTLKSLGLIVFRNLSYQEAIKNAFDIQPPVASQPPDPHVASQPPPSPPILTTVSKRPEWTDEEDAVIRDAKTSVEAKKVYWKAFPESKRSVAAPYVRFYTLKTRKKPEQVIPLPPASPLPDTQVQTESPPPPPPPPSSPLSPAALHRPIRKVQESLPAHVVSEVFPAKVGAPAKIVKGLHEGQSGKITKIRGGQALIGIDEGGKKIETWCLIKDEIVVTGIPDVIPIQTELHGIKLQDRVIQIRGFGAKQNGIGTVVKIEGNKLRVKFATVEKMLYPEEIKIKTMG